MLASNKEDMLKKVEDFNNKSSMLKKVEDFNNKPLVFKIRALILSEQKANELDLERYILKSTKREKDYEFIGTIDDISIVKSSVFKAAPFQSLVYNGEEWILLNTCWSTIEHALLSGIAYKYENNLNSQFASYAGKMLGLKEY